MVEKLLAWYVFFGIGIGIGIDNFYNFVMHVFFGKLSAEFIGWADSVPVRGRNREPWLCRGRALAAFRSHDLRLAAVLGPSVFTLGAAVGHLYQMVTAHNFAPGNAGSKAALIAA